MKDKLKLLEQLLDEEDLDLNKIQEVQSNLLKEHIKGLKIDNYIGDYPTFMEPVILGDDVKIGDDVLIGPKVYIGKNSEIEDYAEISNCIIFDNVKIGKNFKLDNCIITRNSTFKFDNFSSNNSILKGRTETKDTLDIIPF